MVSVFHLRPGSGNRALADGHIIPALHVTDSSRVPGSRRSVRGHARLLDSGYSEEVTMRRLGCIVVFVLYAASARGQDGPSLYASHCSRCHDSGIPRTPSRRVLRALPPEQIVAALETGSMRTQGVAR